MRARSIHTLLTAATVLAVSAGCSSTANGTAIPAPGASTPETTDTPNSTGPGPGSSGAPKVTNPLDATRFVTQPCAALTSDQLRDLNLPEPGKPDTDSAVARAGAPSCSWDNSDIASHAHVAFLTGNKNGLADLYRRHELGDFGAYWIEATIEGYPAVLHDVSDRRSKGNCNLAVGISDTLAIRVGEQDRLREKSCDRAKQVASAVVQTLKRGG